MEDLVSKRILVTGASGMTGAAIALKLAHQGHEVVAFSRGKLPFYEKSPGITWVAGDVQNKEILEKAMVGVNEVYHLAAYATHWAPDLRIFYRTNVLGTINVLESARNAGVKRVVVTTTAGVLGPPDPEDVKPIDETHVRLMKFFNDYEVSKSMVHERVADYVRAGMDVVLVLPTRIWGPGPLDIKNSIGYLFNRFLKGKIVTVPGNGNEIGNFVFVDDVVRGHLLAMERGRAGEKYILGGQNLTMDEIVNTFHSLTGRKSRTLRIPYPLIGVMASFESVLSGLFDRHPFSTHNMIRRLKLHCPVSIEKAKNELGYEPTPFTEALTITEKWLSAANPSYPVLPEPRLSSASVPASPLSSESPINSSK